MHDEHTTDELARLRAEQRQVRDILKLIQDLTSRAVHSESIADLFSRAFPTLYRCVEFDIGIAIMVAQNLDVYMITREGAGGASDALVQTVRARVDELLPPSFRTTDIVVKSEVHDLPPQSDGAGLTYSASSMLVHGERTAGAVLLFRGSDDFIAGEREMLAIFSTQVAMLLDSIRTKEKIATLAETDDLTGMANRRYLRRHLPQEMQRARSFDLPLSLLMFDVDDFKAINDSFGHVFGDVVLSELCGAVNDALRPTDTLARFGGDEFAVILPHTDRAGAYAVAERLITRVRSLVIPTDEEGAVKCSLSIGIAELTEADVTADDFVRRADELMYASKRAGKNRYSGQPE